MTFVSQVRGVPLISLGKGLWCANLLPTSLVGAHHSYWVDEPKEKTITPNRNKEFREVLSTRV